MSLSRDRRPEPALGRVFQAFLAAGWFLRCFLGGKKRQRTAGEDRGFTTFCGQKVHKPPQGNPAVSCRPKSGKDQQSKTVFSTFNIKYFVYESFGNRFRRPRTRHCRRAVAFAAGRENLLRTRECGHCPAGRVRGDPRNRGGAPARFRCGAGHRPHGRRSRGGAGGGSRRLLQGRGAAHLRSYEGCGAHRVVEGVCQVPDGQIRHSDGGFPRIHRLCRGRGLCRGAPHARGAEIRRTGCRQRRGDRPDDGRGRSGPERHAARRQVRRG